MELLPDGQANTAAEVLWEDQQRINKFSTIINKKDELTAVLNKYKTEKEYLDDLSLEIELLDEDEKVQYKIGEAFVYMKVSKAIERVEKDNEKLTAKIEDIDGTLEGYEESLDSLKTDLYAKFGNNINLER
ncbi:Prefoldin beta-like protein [Scheffersomyces coipomensis]|uniref:Prefoldin beta-like protein n=1 Tax=Scheffersomyces coipomensis TaxID=1788519 RepID=UPI00315D4682